MARTCALILPFQPALLRLSCSNKTIQNAPKHYKTHQNMSLRTNGLDWVGSLQKIPMRLHGTNLCINCTISTSFAPVSSIKETLPNATNHYETHENRILGSNWIGCIRCEKFQCNFMPRTCALILPF